ncbi:hypothetical protein CEXT_519361 [Caerostris extrusa]|uniref:Uncharacterized protein n=1 Tax=Caerostris extrusa TaxID=172846 RepID=A0AAV4XNB9_CAEEX|nr:hypothetical protein CEXT_519361 [Caerostris extrusa]
MKKTLYFIPLNSIFPTLSECINQYHTGWLYFFVSIQTPPTLIHPEVMITVQTTFVTWNEGVLLYFPLPLLRLETRMDGPHMSHPAD